MYSHLHIVVILSLTKVDIPAPSLCGTFCQQDTRVCL